MGDLLKKNIIKTKTSDFDDGKPASEVKVIQPVNTYEPNNLLNKKIKQRSNKDDITTARIYKETLDKIKVLTMIRGDVPICEVIETMTNEYIKTLNQEEQQFYNIYMKMKDR